jgi:hypothetical protein
LSTLFFAVSPSCQSSFVFVLGLTTGFVEIGLSFIATSLYYGIREKSTRDFAQKIGLKIVQIAK